MSRHTQMRYYTYDKRRLDTVIYKYGRMQRIPRDIHGLLTPFIVETVNTLGKNFLICEWYGGLPHGPCVYTHWGGIVYRVGCYHMGLRHGEFRMYNRRGDVKRIEMYDMGELKTYTVCKKRGGSYTQNAIDQTIMTSYCNTSILVGKSNRIVRTIFNGVETMRKYLGNRYLPYGIYTPHYTILCTVVFSDPPKITHYGSNYCVNLLLY